MARPRPLPLGILLFLVCTIAAARPSTSDPQAVAIMAASLAALDPGAAPVPTSVSVSGTYQLFQAGSTPSYTMQVQVTGLTQFQWTVNWADGPTVLTINGDTGSMQYADGTTETSSLTAIQGRAVESFPLLALTRWTTDPTVTAIFVGVETVNGASVNHITITRTPPFTATPGFQAVYTAITQCELYVSTQTNLPVRVRYYAHPQDWRIALPVDADFSNYTQISGLLFPLSVVESTNGQQTRALAFQTISVNGTVSRSKPAERLASGGR